MSKITKSLIFSEDALFSLERLQSLIEEQYGDKVGLGKVVELCLDVLDGNIDITTILLHYSIVKDSLLARKQREKKVVG